MDEETYWFKNILNPQHPYHRSYLTILEDDCWKDPKVYDWGCHNIRESIPHPLKQEEIYRKILSRIYDNEDGLMPAEWSILTATSCMASVDGCMSGSLRARPLMW